MRSSKNDFLLDIGKRIRYERKKQSLSQIQLAELSNISDKYLSNIECGRQNPSADVLCRISEALQISIDCLILADIPQTNTILNKQIHDLLNGCSVHEREAILKIVNEIILLVSVSKTNT